MTDAHVTAAVPVRGWRRFLPHRGFSSNAAGNSNSWRWYIRRHVAHYYAWAVAVGVLLMGWLIGDIHSTSGTVVMTGTEIKLVIAAGWFALSHNYWSLELEEIHQQVEKNGALEVNESDYQRRMMNSLYYGVIFVAFVTALFVGIYIFMWIKMPEPIWYGPRFGLVELAIVLHTWWVGRKAIKTVWPIISIIQQAIAGQLRRETKANT